MRYKPVFTEIAVEDLGRLDYKLQFALLADIRRLCEHPALMSRPAPMIVYPAGGQIAQFSHEIGGRWHLCTVLFHYMPNEIELAVLTIGHEESDDPPIPFEFDEP